MDMTEFAKAKEGRLQKHTKAIRDNKISVALMMLYLEGYDVELHYRGHPLADLAQEALDELGYDGIDIWSCSTRDGGIWETWERAALKTGTLDEWEKFQARVGRESPYCHEGCNTYGCTLPCPGKGRDE